MSKTGTNIAGFSMIEVMIACAVLLLGTVMIHESYLRTADLFGRYVHSLQVRLWMNEQLWASKESLIYSMPTENLAQEGAFTWGGKKYQWSEDIHALFDPSLYSLRLNVDWNEGNQPMHLTKEIYAFKKEPL